MPSLSGPRVAVVDRELLEKLAARHLPVIEPKRAPRVARPRLRGLATRFTDRKKAPRYLLYGALMLASADAETKNYLFYRMILWSVVLLAVSVVYGLLGGYNEWG